MDFNLTDDQIDEIQLLNAKLVAIKNFIREVSNDNNDVLFSKLMNELAKNQMEYDQWFDKMSAILNVITRPDQRWSVDFKAKKLQLLG